MTPVNPQLKPIAEAVYGEPVVLYSAEDSPMWCEAFGASIEMGWRGNGSVAGFHTARYGFFADDPDQNQEGLAKFRWTHFMPLAAFAASGYESPTHHLHCEAGGYLDVDIYGFSVEDCQARLAQFARAKCKLSGGSWAEELIMDVGYRPEVFIRELRQGTWVDGELVAGVYHKETGRKVKKG